LKIKFFKLSDGVVIKPLKSVDARIILIHELGVQGLITISSTCPVQEASGPDRNTYPIKENFQKSSLANCHSHVAIYVAADSTI
jgi:hypothetical protein